MANATTEAELKLHGPYESVKMDVAASTKVYKGRLVMPDGSGDLVDAGDTAGRNKAYLCLETVDNTSGAAGDLKAEILIRGTFSGFSVGTLTAADNGATAMAVDNQTVSNAATTTNDVPVGRVDGFDDEDSSPIITV